MSSLVTGKLIDNLKLYISNQQKISFHEPDKISEMVKKLEQITDGLNTTLNMLDLEALLHKVKSKKNNPTITLTRREKNNLPFIIYREEVTLEDARYILENMNMTNNKMLTRELHVYFMNYSSNQKNELVRLDILKKIPRIKNASKRLETWTKNDFLLKMNAPELMVGRLKYFGFKKIMENIMFDSLMFTSGLLKETIKKFFKSEYIDLRVKLDKFYEMNSYGYGTIDNVFTLVANNLIPAVDNDSKFYNDRNILKNIFYEKYGDPRLPLNSTAWNTVDQNVRNIFLKWIAQSDVKLFFEIIKKVSSGVASGMWAAREKFWNDNLHKVTSAWVFLGYNAAKIANNINDDRLLDYGEFLGDGNKSAILFTIGDYTFVERSYNGACYIWNKENCPIHVGDKTLKQDNIVRSGNERNKVNHLGQWQNNIKYYIGRD